MRAFVTGATGLLGSHLTRELLNGGHEVVALIRDVNPGCLFWRDLDKFICVQGQVEDYALLERALNEYEIDTVFHLAAQAIVGTANRSPLSTFKANIGGTWNILEAARVHRDRIKAVIVASSDKAYGDAGGAPYSETTPLRGAHPYDVSKSCADLLAQSYFKTYGLPVAITRCGNLFGPGDIHFNRIIPGTIQSVLKNEAPIIRSDGKFVRDYLYVEDAAQAYRRLAETVHSRPDIHGEAFNFSYDGKMTVLDLVGMILRLMDSKLEPVILNQAPNEIPYQALDSRKARQVLNWVPDFGLERGLKETIEWYTNRL